MGNEGPMDWLPPAEELKKFDEAQAIVDKVERIDASYPVDEMAERRTANSEAEKARWKQLEEKELASMAGGAQLTFSERQELMRKRNATGE